MPILTSERPDVATLVRERTIDAHRSAESRPFIVSLMRGELSLEDYTRYLAQLAWIYEALEARDGLDGDPEILDPALARLDSIEADLLALGVTDRRSEHPALHSTAAYAIHLRTIEPIDVHLYVAHHYTRYLGDLSGGQAIARLVARHYDAREDQLSYFRFEGVADIVHYKREYRDRLNGLRFTPTEVDDFLDEASHAFDFNSAIFDELGN